MERDFEVFDSVNRPEHYASGSIECIDAMKEAMGTAQVLAFCKCNAFKYIWRADRKNRLEDMKKARWYIDKYIELASNGNNK